MFRRARFALFFVGGCMAASAAFAQAIPRVGYVFPAGGQQGTSFEVIFGGQYLDGVSTAVVSGEGVQAELIEYVKPITQGTANKLRDELKELLAKKAAAQGGKKGDNKDGPKPQWTEADAKRVAEIQKRLATFVRKPANPTISETVTFKITAAPNAAPGDREIRLKTALGLTNPLVFQIGQLPEVSEKVERKQPLSKYTKYVPKSKSSSNRPDFLDVAIPAVVNGQIMPGEVDLYRFKATKGQRLVIAAAARRLIPYLPDGVPGWFQATLALYDAEGNELAYDDDFRFDPDPVLFVKIPADGEYLLEIKDSIYRGREDFVYRIAIGEMPFVTSVFPLGMREGAKTGFSLKGWNLPSSKWSPKDSDVSAGVHELTVSKNRFVSNRMPFAVDALAELPEKEPNNDRTNAQRVELPIIVNGRIQEPNDVDVFSFQGRAGQQIVAEVNARRLNSPLDSVLQLTDATGKLLAANDDRPDNKGSGLVTHHADSYLAATLPADGVYYLQIGDTQHQGGPDYAYRLRIGPPMPDFDLRIVPSSVNARMGTPSPVTVYALRKDGFSGPIDLTLKDAPAGFSIQGGRIPAGQDQVRFTLIASSDKIEKPIVLQLEGRATVDGKSIARRAVPAEDMMQAFEFRHLVPAQEWVCSVTGQYKAKTMARVEGDMPVKIPIGGTASVQVTLSSSFSAKSQFSLFDPPDGMEIKEVKPTKQGAEIVLTCDAEKVKSATQGNLIVSASTKPTADKSKPKANKALPQTTLPAIPFEVIDKK